MRLYRIGIECNEKTTINTTKTMLNFDLMDTVAGKQVYDMGLQKGVINEAQEMVLKAIDVRFGMVPNEVVETIHGISQQDVLENLLTQAIISPDRGSFKEILSKTTEKK